MARNYFRNLINEIPAGVYPRLRSGTGMTVLLSFFFATSVFALELPQKPDNYVSDFADIIDDSAEQQMNQQLLDFTAETGHEVAVVTVTDLQGDSIENFANELFRAWGIGTADNDNGVLLLVARDDRRMRIEVGYGLEGALTDAESSNIVRTILQPAFRDSDYTGGISAGLERIQAEIRGEQFDYAEPESTIDWGNVIVVVFFVLSFLGPLVFKLFLYSLGKSPSWWQGGVFGGGAAGVIAALANSGVLQIVLWSLLASSVGLLIDYWFSRNYEKWNKKATSSDNDYWHWGGTGGSGGWGSSSGGFSGFSGGSSGGGGSSGSW